MLALSTDSLRGYGLNRIFEFAKNAQYDGIDLFFNLKQFDTQNADYINKLIKQYNIPVVSVQAPENSNSDILKRVIKLAKKINCNVVIVQPPKLLKIGFVKWLKKEVPKLRQKENISIALENAPSDTLLGILPGHAMSGIIELKKFKHVCIDTSRAAEKKEDLIRLYKILKQYIVEIHISNIYKNTPYYLPYKGVLPLESLLTKLKQNNFPGIISIKVEPKFMKVGDDEMVADELNKCRNFYLEYFLNA